MQTLNIVRGVLLTLPVLLAACVTESTVRDIKPVPAGYIYKDAFIIVRPPDAPGWYLVDASVPGIGFAKHGEESSDSIAAQVLFFHLAPTKSKDELLSLVKQWARNDIESGRFEEVESVFEYSEDRGYPCVKVTSILKDKEAVISPNRRSVLLLQGKALFCRHPKSQDSGFNISYSYRGQSLYPKLDAEAQRFIDGVQVPRN